MKRFGFKYNIDKLAWGVYLADLDRGIATRVLVGEDDLADVPKMRLIYTLMEQMLDADTSIRKQYGHNDNPA